jgi:acetyl-CoA synthetase
MILDESRRLIPQQGDWQAMRAAFRWPRPERFNIARACCDDWAARDPGREAITHLDASGGRQVWTYGRLKEQSDRLANALAARGLRRGDRLAILLPQCPEVMVTHFAAMKLGCVALPLFTLFGPDALRFRLSDSGARAVVTDAEGAEKLDGLRADLPDLREVFVTGPARAPFRSLEGEIAAASDRLTPVDTLADDPAVLIYTSGTTGNPKGVLHAHRFLIGHLPSMETVHEGFPKPGDRGWTPADWAWIGGLMDMAMPCLYYGIPQLSGRMRRFDPDEAFALIRAEGLRNLFLPPTALKLMRQARVPPGIALRSVGSGGESLGAILDWAREALGVVPNELYGQTECNLVCGSSWGSMEIRPGSMGQAVPGFEVALLGPDGTPVPTGEMGEISVRRGTPGMFLRYWNRPEATAAKWTGDWMRTGDLATQDADGYVTFASRDDDVITSSGYRIGPTEIENCLTGHPDVVMAAAVGHPDPVRTEVVVAHVVLREGLTLTPALEAELIARVRSRISAHVAPRRVVQEASLPMTATGKIMRRELRPQ